MLLSIYQDTKEKIPFEFKFHPACGSVVVKHLETGDYTLKDYENIVCIERKRSTGEIANNFGKESKRFENELERMSHFKYKYVICEFPIDHILNFPENSGIPKRTWKYIRIRASFLMKKITEYTEKYGVIFEFCDNREKAMERIIQIFTEVING